MRNFRILTYILELLCPIRYRLKTLCYRQKNKTEKKQYPKDASKLQHTILKQPLSIIFDIHIITIIDFIISKYNKITIFKS